MWHDNLGNPRDVVIRTKFSKLKSAIASNEVYGGKVQYRDLEDFEMMNIGMFAKKFVKHDSMDKEEEFRLLISRRSGEQEDPPFIEVPVSLPKAVGGITVRADLRPRSLKKVRRLLDLNGISVAIEVYRSL